jgi:hypothetical protein
MIDLTALQNIKEALQTNLPVDPGILLIIIEELESSTRELERTKKVLIRAQTLIDKLTVPGYDEE